MKKHLIRGALVLSATFTGSVTAQETATSSSTQSNNQAGAGTSAYPSSYFTDQSLVTAFDLVGYVPGFTFRGGDNSRGLSDAAGNVLIDGRRPSAKSVSLQQLLRRIPASAVERIDIIRGGAASIDMQGQPVIANVVRRGGASRMGSIEAMTKIYPDGEPGRTLRAEQSRQANALTLEGALELKQEQNQNRNGSGNLVRQSFTGEDSESGSYVAEFWKNELAASGAAAWDTSAGLVRFSVAIALEQEDENERTRLWQPSGSWSDEETSGESVTSRIEIGGDYSRDLGQSDSIEFVALQSLERSEDDAGRGQGVSRQLAIEESSEGESIMRASWRRQVSPNFNIEAGAEGAFNFLESDSTLTRGGVVVDLPSAKVRVEELRSEAFSTATMRPWDNLSLTAGLRAEVSEITVSGGADASNRFTYIKPRAVVAYSAAGDRQLRLGLEREVGQLDFGDFAAGSEFSSNTVNAGNPDLAPEQAWVLELGYEQPIFTDGALALTFRHSEVEDVIDLIPISGFAAPGNIGDGRRQELVLSMTLPFDNMGPGLGRLQIDTTVKDSSVTDPVTGEQRRISSEVPLETDITYTRDFPGLNGSFGVRGDIGNKRTAYRIDQLISERTSGFWRVYWDWRPRQDINIRTQIENVLSRESRRHRDIYADTRAEAAIAATEERGARFDPFLMLRVRWNF